MVKIPQDDSVDPPMWQTQMLRATKFGWVYYHEQNLQHGELDNGAIQFVMDKITKTLNGQIPVQISPAPTNYTNIHIVRNQLKCNICNFAIPFPITCDNCGQLVFIDSTCTSFNCVCGNSITYPILHCGQPMVFVSS